MVAGGAAGAPVGTWTVLFTDQVGSTAMRVRVGEDAFDAIRADLGFRVAAVLTAHGVVVTKSIGDGVMGGFGSTAAALRCAVAIQQAVAERNRTVGEGVAGDQMLALRVGVGVGDAAFENGDLHGTAVVEAARLCAAAPGGTILCTEAVRVVSANRSGCTFGPVHQVTLKGLPGPVAVQEVTWAPLPYGPGEHRLAFRVLGPLEVVDRDKPVSVGGPKERFVLALLLARVNSSVSVDALIDAVWGDRPPRTAERTVHAYVARLRRTLEPRRPRGEPSTLLVTVGRGYELRLDASQLDATRFEQLARRGADQLGRGDDAAPLTLREALGLWRGAAFGEFREVEGCAAEARRLEELRQGLVEDRVDADLAAGRSAELVGEIETLLRDEPFRERLWGQLIVALYRSGRQRDALEAYQQARRLLADELGIEPGPELRRLEAAVLAQDPSLDVLRPAPAAIPGGLPAALTAVGPAFLGRETELAWLRGAWTNAVDGRGGLVSVLGPEGIGKTRLVAELAREVHEDAAAVVYGRCDHAHRGAKALLGQALQSAGSSLADIDADDADDGGIAAAVARHLPTSSQGRPVLVVLDDLHLADAETLEVVAELAGWCRAMPMLVVGAFRSDALPSAGPAEPPSGGTTQLALRPLSDDDVGRICDLYAIEPWSAQDVDRLFELTGGIPLLVHEQASEWARERASRRMAEAGDRVAVTRRRLAATRGEIANEVEGIQQLLDQRRAQLTGREAQLQASLVAALGGCPYKGLARFEAADAANFFGRERLVAELVARLAESRLLAVVGPSGSGKSSLVRAGLLPAVAAGMLPGGQPRRSVIVCPGPHPAQELARCLGDDRSEGASRVVFVDQFEATFAAGADRAEQDAFVGRLLELAGPADTAVVLAIRADHLGRCATFPELADRLAGNDVLVGPMRDSELRRTVELPAQRAGLEIGAGLADVIVSDVAGRAGALPLLSTALAETWERREGRALTLAGYRATGGVNGALARMAEDAYTTLPPRSRAAARRLLLRLCDAGEDGDLSLRRRLPVSEATDEDDADARAALETLAGRRLLTIDRNVVEVAHEALLREWPRLRTWLDEDVQGHRLHRRLHDAARSWEAAGHDPSELYRGTRLGAAADWAAGHDDELSHTERSFLDASRIQAERELADARRQAAERAHANRRLRTLLAGVGVLLVGAVLAGLLAVRESGQANEQAGAARAEAREADLRRLISDSQAQRATRKDRALLLAAEAERLNGGVDARSALFGTLQSAPGFLGYLRLPDDEPAFTAAAVTDGNAIIVGDADGRIVRFDPSTHEPIGQPIQVGEPGRAVTTLATDRAGTRVAVAFEGSRIVRLFEAGELVSPDVDGARLGRTVETPDIPFRLAISEGGDVAISGRETGAVTVVKHATGATMATIPATNGPTAVAFDRRGRLAIGSAHGVDLRVPGTYAPKTSLTSPGVSADGAIEFSPDDSRLVSAAHLETASGQDILTSLMAWDIAERRAAWPGSSATICYDVALLEKRVLCGGLPGGLPVVVMLDLESGQETTGPLDATFSALPDLALSPDRTTLIISARNRALAGVISLDGRSAIGQLIGAPGSYPVNYSPDGSLLMLESGTRSIGIAAVGPRQLWDTRRGQKVADLDVLAGIFAPDGRVAAVFDDLSVGLLDPTTGHRTPLAAPHSLDLTSVTFDATRGRIAVGFGDGVVEQRDLVSGNEVGRTIRVDGVAESLAYVRGGRVLAVSAGDQVEFFDADRGDSAMPPVSVPGGSVAASPDGSVLATATRNGEVTLRDPATGKQIGRSLVAGNARNNWISISDDNALLLATTWDGTAWLFDVATHTQISDAMNVNISPTIATHFGGVIRPDGQQMALATDDAVQLWDLDPAAWREAACRLAGRNLTRAEWERYLPDGEPYHVTCPQWPPSD
jgi:DNA-binding SARP family transcriptional activator/class 3 adenylate cyclase/WD40 repeat protein